jgi:hypothetical protein
VSLGLTSVATTPLECVSLAGYRPRLIFWMVLPVVLVLVFVSLVLCGRAIDATSLRRSLRRSLGLRDSNASTDTHPEPQRNQTTIEKTLQPALLLMFVLYPKVSRLWPLTAPSRQPIIAHAPMRPGEPSGV